MELQSFEDRLKWGDEAVLKTLNIFKEKNLYCDRIVTNQEFDNTIKEFGRNSTQYEEKRKMDEEYGDIWVSRKSLPKQEDIIRIEIKRQSVPLKTMKNSYAKYFLIWNASLTEAIVINSSEFKNINEENCITLPSGDKGFTYDQVKKFKHVTFNEFIKTI